MNSEDFSFFIDAIRMFRDAGHTIAFSPIFSNHSYEQVVYFDTEKSLIVDDAVKIVLNLATHISHLFDLSDDLFEDKAGKIISYYSIVIESDKRYRSQLAHDIHALLHATFIADISVVLFKNEESCLISIADIGDNIVLSDWFDYYDDMDKMSEKINIAQLSLNSAYDFISDLVYIVERDYYTHPLPQGTALYELIPTNYFCMDIFRKDYCDDTKSLKDVIKDLTLESQLAYGDDYVEPIFDEKHNMSSIDDELNILVFGLDLGEEFEKDIINDEDDIIDDEELKKDEYEFANVDQKTFKDPNSVLEWLEKLDLN